MQIVQDSRTFFEFSAERKLRMRAPATRQAYLEGFVYHPSTENMSRSFSRKKLAICDVDKKVCNPFHSQWVGPRPVPN